MNVYFESISQVYTHSLGAVSQIMIKGFTQAECLPNLDIIFL